MSVTVLGGWGAANWWIGLPLFALYVWWMVRPWFLGVWVGERRVVVQSWFRRYTFAEGDVKAIDIVYYFGLVAGAPIGWLPFAGKVRMVQVETTDGRTHYLAVTLARRNSALQLARRMGAVLGLKPL